MLSTTFSDRNGDGILDHSDIKVMIIVVVVMMVLRMMVTRHTGKIMKMMMMTITRMMS